MSSRILLDDQWAATEQNPQTAVSLSSPRRIQRRRTQGWRMPVNAIYVGRPTCWGNPYEARRCCDSSLWTVHNRKTGDKPLVWFGSKDEAVEDVCGDFARGCKPVPPRPM